MFSWPSLHERMCRMWGSNSGPFACQTNTLLIELPRPALPLNDFLTFFLKECIFSHKKSKRKQFDIAVKKVKVNQWSSFEQTLLDPCPQCCIPRSLPLWFRRRFLKGIYHIWVWQPSWSCDPDPHPPTNFCSPHPCRLHMKSGFDCPSGFWEDVW